MQSAVKTAQAIGEYETTARMADFLRLKVEGILECGELLVATLCDKRDAQVFGRRTLPEMDIASILRHTEYVAGCTRRRFGLRLGQFV